MIIVVTKEPELVNYLLKNNIIRDKEYKVFERVGPKDVRNRDVIGSLPYFLACEANTVTEIPLRRTDEMRGRILTLSEIESIAGEHKTYVIQQIIGDEL